MKTYAEKLKDPRWQRKRLEILQRDDFRCQTCGDHTKTLHVHHIRYIKGRDPWEYKNWYLVTLCEDCHKDAEAEVKAVAKPKAKPLIFDELIPAVGEPVMDNDVPTREEFEAFFTNLKARLDQ